MKLQTELPKEEPLMIRKTLSATAIALGATVGLLANPASAHTPCIGRSHEHGSFPFQPRIIWVHEAPSAFEQNPTTYLEKEYKMDYYNALGIPRFSPKAELVATYRREIDEKDSCDSGFVGRYS